MKVIAYIFLLSVAFSCTEVKTEDKVPEYDEKMAAALAKMVEIDQLAANNAFPPEEYSHYSQPQWEAFKDSVYRAGAKKANALFKRYGFIGYDLAGKEGSNDFWLLVQHADHDPDFQSKVLEKMKIEVDKQNADSRKYGLLVDRVNLNTGKQQIYGTQVDFNHQKAQAYPKNLADSATVNQRRAAIGLEPIEEYLNGMSIMHFEMNKEGYLEKGITDPTLYE